MRGVSLAIPSFLCIAIATAAGREIIERDELPKCKPLNKNKEESRVGLLTETRYEQKVALINNRHVGGKRDTITYNY